jgi:lipoyl(octanoyl) transferase
MTVCEVRRLGRVPYAEAWELQKQLAGQRAAGLIPDTLLLLEHPHTYTLGRSGHAANLLLDEAQLAARGISLHWVDRGGDITYHGPGQLVGYPIMALGSVIDDATGRIPQADYVGFVRRIEETLIRAIARFGLVTGQVKGLTGVWVQPDVASRCVHCPPASRRAPSKLAAIGVKVDARGISQHGFALNVAPDMSYWDGIIGCGLADHAPVSLADLLDTEPPLPAVMDAVVESFGRVFDRQMVERPPE